MILCFKIAKTIAQATLRTVWFRQKNTDWNKYSISCRVYLSHDLIMQHGLKYFVYFRFIWVSLFVMGDITFMTCYSSICLVSQQPPPSVVYNKFCKRHRSLFYTIIFKLIGSYFRNFLMRNCYIRGPHMRNYVTISKASYIYEFLLWTEHF